MKVLIKKIRHVFRIIVLSSNETVQNIKFCGFYRDRPEKIKWRLVLLAHSLEKGLAMRNKRKDFGLEKARDLGRYLNSYRTSGMNICAYEYREAAAVLLNYLTYRQQNGLDTHNLEALVSEFVNTELPKAGYEELSMDDVRYNWVEFESLCKKRHSIREFSDKPVTFEEINHSVELALTAPSACNRQMVKVYYSENMETNKKLSALIPGNKGFEDGSCKYLFIIADRTAFDYFELDQWYMNGGIFVAYLQLAFAANEIGSCIYQWPKELNTEKKVKHILNIPDNEVIVSVLGVGHYKERFNVLASSRKNCSEFICIRDINKTRLDNEVEKDI